MIKTESKTISTGKCGRPPNSAYIELMKKDEDWRQVDNASERRKIQNRLAQRAYRRSLRDRNKEVEALREQLSRLQGINSQNRDNIKSSNSGDRTPGSSNNPKIFDSYPDSDDSISFDSGSSPGDRSVQSGATDLGAQIMYRYQDHTRLSPLPPAYSNIMHPYEGCCSRRTASEDPEQLPTRPFHPSNDYEPTTCSTTNHHHRHHHHHPAPLPQRSPRYPTPVEFNRSISLDGGGEETSSLCFGYSAGTATAAGGTVASIPTSIRDFAATAPGTPQDDDDDTTTPITAANIQPALYDASLLSSPPQTLAAPGPQHQSACWPHMDACAILSLLHVAVTGGHMETVRLILDRWPQLAHAIDAEGYTAVQRAIMAGREDMVSLFIQ